MKKVLITVLMAISAGVAYAGSAADQLGVGRIDAPEIPVPASIEKVSTGSGLLPLYQLWIEDTFASPGDKQLVVDEMHKLLGSSSRAEIIQVKVMLSNKNAWCLDVIKHYEEVRVSKLLSLRKHLKGVSSMTDDELTSYATGLYKAGELGWADGFNMETILTANRILPTNKILSEALIREISLVEAALK